MCHCGNIVSVSGTFSFASRVLALSEAVIPLIFVHHEGHEGHEGVGNFVLKRRLTIHDNFRGLRKFSGRRRPLGFGYASRQDAKDAKFGNQFLFFTPFAFFARDTPRLTGARSAPYENLRDLRAFVVNPTFFILVAAQPRWVLRGKSCISLLRSRSERFRLEGAVAFLQESSEAAFLFRFF